MQRQRLRAPLHEPGGWMLRADLQERAVHHGLGHANTILTEVERG